jgi:hypothetical protein
VPHEEAIENAALRTPRRSRLSEKSFILEGEEPSNSKGKQPAQGPDSFLLRRRNRVRRICDDIPSKAVTDMILQGMIIDEEWLTRGDPGWHPVFHDEDAEGETDKEDSIQPFIDDDTIVTTEGRAAGPVDGVSPASGPSQHRQPDRASGWSSRSEPQWAVLPGASENDTSHL